MKTRIAVAAFVALLEIGISGCSHGINSLPPTSHTVAQQPSGPRAAGATDTSDGCPVGQYMDESGNCMKTIGGGTTTCDYTCSSNKNPCVSDPSLCTVPQPGGGGGGGGAGPTPTPSPTPVPCDQTGNKDVDAIVNGSSAVKKALTTVSNLGHKPTITDTTDSAANDPTGIHNGHAAETDTTTGDIALFSDNMAASGQPSDQILFHELAHGFYYVDAPNTLTGTATVTLYDSNGNIVGTISYDFSNSDAIDAYNHVWVHNDINSAFAAAGDQTGSAFQAFGITGITHHSDTGINDYSYAGGVSVKDATERVNGFDTTGKF